jgi:hypothetical protein
MPNLKRKMTQSPSQIFQQGSQLADLFGGIIDQPLAGQYSNPTYARDPGFSAFASQLSKITGQPFESGGLYNPQQFAETQNPPQYRGIRALLPQSGGEYVALNQGRIPNYDALQQAFLGEMIRRGYPVLGGTGQFVGREPGFNPIGFGQR